MALVSGFQVNLIRTQDGTIRQDLQNAEIVAGLYDDVTQPFGIAGVRRRVIVDWGTDPTGQTHVVVWTARAATKQGLLDLAVTIRNTLPGGTDSTP